ncbi:MAG TPA: polyphenol oxidase family protein [Thermoanaerobaculia bacterium]|nr:polyphenol oxidase family protein [Thermoanaerobaculia bacterium]
MWKTEPSAIGRIVVPPQIPAGFAVFCTTRDHRGEIVPEVIARVLRERFAIEAATLATCVQVHSANVVRVNERVHRDCDALWANERGTALGIKVADCLPIAIIDPVHAIVADIHSGWRGAAQQIVAKTLDALEGFDPASSYAYLGPSIRVCCFEVGEEVAAQFDARFVESTPTKPHVDLVAMTIAILRERGVAHIFDSGLCTRCEGSIFHSYRRDGGGGRNLMIAAL